MANQPGIHNSILAEMIKIIEKQEEWGNSGPIPSRPELMRRFHTSAKTMENVFMLLHAQGYILRRGRNVVVNPHRFAFPLLVPAFDRYLEERGIAPFMENMGDGPERVTLTPELAHSFGLADGTPAVKRARLQGEIFNNRKIPYRLAETYYLYELVKDYLPEMRRNPRFVGIDEIKKKTGKSIQISTVTSYSRFPATEEQDVLQITMNTPITEIFRVCLSEDSTIIMFSHIIAPAYRVQLQFTTSTPL